MSENESSPQPVGTDANYQFLALLFSLTSAAWAQLGKVPHPVSGKVERDIKQAQQTIDLLRMLRDKTQGNLTDKEEELLENSLSDLELNFVDELSKEQSRPNTADNTETEGKKETADKPTQA